MPIPINDPAASAATGNPAATTDLFKKRIILAHQYFKYRTFLNIYLGNRVAICVAVFTKITFVPC